VLDSCNPTSDRPRRVNIQPVVQPVGLYHVNGSLTSCCRQLATAGVSDGVVRGATSTAATERHRRRSQKAAQLDATAVQADAPAPGPGGDRREGLPERGQVDHRRRRRRRVDAERQQRPADPPLRDDHRQQRAAVVLTRDHRRVCRASRSEWLTSAKTRL